MLSLDLCSGSSIHLRYFLTNCFSDVHDAKTDLLSSVRVGLTCPEPPGVGNYIDIIDELLHLSAIERRRRQCGVAASKQR